MATTTAPDLARCQTMLDLLPASESVASSVTDHSIEWLIHGLVVGDGMHDLELALSDGVDDFGWAECWRCGEWRQRDGICGECDDGTGPDDEPWWWAR